MQFLKILFWCLIAFIAAVFTFGNWKWVPISLFGNLVAEMNLPLLLLITFLIGFVPTLIYSHAVRWRLRQRLTSAERTVADMRAMAQPAPIATTPIEPVILSGTTADVPSPGAA